MIAPRRCSTALLLPLLFALPVRAGAPEGGYAVVTSKATRDDPSWGAVVRAVAEAHEAPVIVFDGSVDEASARLKEVLPRYACFVARPEEAGRDFVAKVHRLVRKLDDDPYADVRWGILTGHDAGDALRVARLRDPLTVRSVVSGTEVALELCEQGSWYSELTRGRMVEKKKGETPKEGTAPSDTTATFVEALNEGKADLFVTSGHATERDWQIGFGFRNGSFRSRDGLLLGRDTKGTEIPVRSTNPKVYLAVGNCLMGHVDGKDAMALAWMHSAGVAQMVGYTELTWYGYGGWGCLDYFLEQPGRFTLAEAFLANQHALIHRLEASSALADSDRKGLIHDRDAVAFYGDPAWSAKMADGPKAWEQSLTESDGTFTLTITPNRGTSTFRPINTNGSERGGRPIIAYLPYRVAGAEVVEGSDLHPTITDDFLLVPNPGECDPSRTYRVTFRARRLAP